MISNMIMTNSTVKTRASQYEFLRIISIYMVLFQHANFYSLGRPDEVSWESFLTCFGQSVSIIGVNIFILISGYFGVNFNLNKLLNIAFQCIYCVIPISLIAFFTNHISINNFAEGFRYFWPFGFWYIVAYVGLIIFSPLVNKGLSTLNKVQYRWLIGAILAYTFLFDCILADNTIALNGGYTALWLIILYIIARYIRTYGLKISLRNCIYIFITCVILKAILLLYHINGTRYTNPLTLLASLSFFYAFTYIEIKNHFINVIAASTLMVYLLNMHPIIIKLYVGFFRNLYLNYGLASFEIQRLLYCAAFFIIAILYDRTRIFIWERLPISSKKFKQIF